MEITRYGVVYFFIRKLPLTTVEPVKFVVRKLESWNAFLTGHVLDLNNGRERWRVPYENREFRIKIPI